MAYYPTNVLDNQIKALPTIASASGSVANFTTDKAENLVKCVCEVASGSTELNITACGVNIWNEETEEGYINSSGGYNSSSTSIRSKYFTPVKEGKSYYLKRPDNYTSGYVCLYDENQNFLNRRSLDNSVYTIASGTHYIKISCYNYGSSGYQNDISINYPSTDTQYHAYNGNTYNIQLGETLSDTAIYNAVTGVLTRNDTTTKQLDSCPIVTIANSENNIWSDTGDIEVKFVLSVGEYVNQNL